MNSKRPKNLNLFSIRFPMTAIASICHRLSGFALFLLIPVMLWLFSLSLTLEGYTSLQLWCHRFSTKIIFWLLLMPFCYHLVAGVRHLLSDIHIGNTRTGGKWAAMFTFVFAAVLILLVGIWLW